jgi:Ohr subfamily peroxiredoxin
VIKITPSYTTTVTVTGGRSGHAVSDDGELDVQTRRPKTNGKSGGTNPEQLFAAAWGACYQSALTSVARDTGDDVSASTVNVTISQGPAEGGGWGLAAKIAVDVPGLERVRIAELAQAAHRLCPYSRAIGNNIEVEISPN